MRSYLIPAILAATIGTVSMAAAATTTSTGEVKAFDAKTHELTLADGTIYYLPATFADPGLKAGEKVSVVWEMKNNQHDASSVTIMK